MSFDVGDKVVYPHHGAAIIESGRRRRSARRSEYLVCVLPMAISPSFPVDNAAEIGFREVINDEEVEEVFAVLRKKEARMPTNWSRRFKNHVEKLKSGDIYQVAGGGPEPLDRIGNANFHQNGADPAVIRLTINPTTIGLRMPSSFFGSASSFFSWPIRFIRLWVLVIRLQRRSFFQIHERIADHPISHATWKCARDSV